MSASASPDRDDLARLVHRVRLLVAAEREGGVVDLPGTPAPETPPEVVGVPSVAAVQQAAAAAPSPPPPSPPRAPEPRPAPAPTDFTPRVRPMDLPPDVLAPFGSLPTEVAACTRCVLASTRTQTVFGEGLPTARLVFCGEAPGFEEDRSGRPFVGRAGELLTDMIEKGLRLRREEVFVLNAIKCRPPENRTPLPDEIASCRPFLERQLATIRPQVIVALGNPACRALLGPVPGIMSIRGKVFEGFGAKIVPTFHPAYLLRNPDAKREVWTDLKLVLRLLGGSPSGAATNAPS